MGIRRTTNIVEYHSRAPEIIAAACGIGIVTVAVGVAFSIIVATLFVCILAACYTIARIYVEIRDRPTYKSLNKDIEYAHLIRNINRTYPNETKDNPAMMRVTSVRKDLED